MPSLPPIHEPSEPGVGAMSLETLTRYPESVQHARDHDGKTDGNGHVRFYRVRPLIYAGTLAEREAEHLQDMLHCQERVVNLLMAARIMCDAFAVPDDGSGDDDVEVYFREPLKILREAIRKEEKENGNDNK